MEKKIWTTFSLALLMFWNLGTQLQAQSSLPNGDFENWVAGGTGQYEQPDGAWWTSLNPLASLGGPVTVEKTTDAVLGSYAAKLTTKQWGSILIPGLLVSGTFDVQNPNFIIQGKPFTDRPERFMGQMKYHSVNGDSAGIAALLTRWNTTTGRRDTIAEASLVQYDSVATWTRFDLPFVYSQTGVNPDSIIVAVVSSFGGVNFQGQVGSTLWIDALELAYLANGASEEYHRELEGKAWFAQNQIKLHFEENQLKGMVKVWAMDGRLILQDKIKTGNQAFEFESGSGLYLIEVSSEKGGFWHGKAFKAQ